MAHTRETIRKAIVTAVTGLTATGSNVTVMRAHPFSESDLPSINVVPATEEQNDSMSEIGDYDVRDLVINLEVREKTLEGSTYGMADNLDDITEQVETAMHGALATLRAAGCYDVQYRGVEWTIDDEGDQPVGLAVMEYLVTYRVSRAAP